MEQIEDILEEYKDNPVASGIIRDCIAEGKTASEIREGLKFLEEFGL